MTLQTGSEASGHTQDVDFPLERCCARRDAFLLNEKFK